MPSGSQPPNQSLSQNPLSPNSACWQSSWFTTLGIVLPLFLCAAFLASCASIVEEFSQRFNLQDRVAQIRVQVQDTHASAQQSSTVESMTGQQTAMPQRDLRELALRLRPGVNSIPESVRAPQYAVGDRILFWVSNLDINQQSQIEAELLYKNDVVYVWVESGQELDQNALTASADNFAHKIYPHVRAFFGNESNPGIDQDPRLHILHASSLGGGIAGYFSSADSFSSLANPFSNQKEMFYVSLDWLKRSNDFEEYETVLAHEFQHMVHWYNDRNEDSWVNEGMSELAQEVAGYPPHLGFARVYAAQPDTQLNTWSMGENDNGRHYGAAYLFMAYFLQRFGDELTRTVVSQPANGIQGFTDALQEAGSALAFEDVFADWVVANYVNDFDALGEQGVYGYRQLQLPERVHEETFLRYPQKTSQSSVRNFGVDYIGLHGRGDVSVHFQGNLVTRFADVDPYSGDFVWWSNRADDSDMRLTRAFDFSNVGAGTDLTMSVQMWFDIEEDYDYGYVVVSRDGRKWDILPGQQTTPTNPSGNSFGHAYTAKSLAATDSEQPGWIRESIDLHAYAGDEVLVRFEYVTDDAVNAPGWFIDDVRIPAIGYAADFENGADGWVSEGWLLTNNRLPQEWLVQIMAIHDGELMGVERAPVGADGMARIDVDGLLPNSVVVLAISGLTPGTTEEALYDFRIERR